MAEITIRFRHNAKTGKRELVIHLESDSDVLPHEHERDHRRLVEGLIGMPVDEDTSVVVERIAPAPAGAAAAPTTTPTTTAQPAATSTAKQGS